MFAIFRLRIYNWRKLTPLVYLSYHADTVNAVDFSENLSSHGQLLAAGGKDARITLWSLYNDKKTAVSTHARPWTRLVDRPCSVTVVLMLKDYWSRRILWEAKIPQTRERKWWSDLTDQRERIQDSVSWQIMIKRKLFVGSLNSLKRLMRSGKVLKPCFVTPNYWITRSKCGWPRRWKFRLD